MTLARNYGLVGNVDVANHDSEVSLNGGPAGNLIMRQIGTDWYVMAAGEIASAGQAPANMWMHLDIGGLPVNTRLRISGSDPKQVGEMFATATDVAKFGDNGFVGKIDFTKAPSFTSVAPSGRTAEAEQLVNRLRSVPFGASLDARGHLVSVVIHVDRIAPELGKATMDFSDFGAPIEVREPLPSQTVPMPVSFSRALGIV